ncbi:MAG: hypothetical protein LUD77_08030, partial [Clostridiales bacterium]|nr:hypothetical protein [Clostridiales bacterium]
SIMSDINNALYIYDKNFFNNFLENMTKLKENAAMEQADECNCGHDHHHHNDGCGCGHDHHHHGEGCGCGHDHHHHEEGCDHNHSHFEKHL